MIELSKVFEEIHPNIHSVLSRGRDTMFREQISVFDKDGVETVYIYNKNENVLYDRDGNALYELKFIPLAPNEKAPG